MAVAGLTPRMTLLEQLSFVAAWIACAIYVLVAIIWLVPDRRIEKTLVE